MTAHKSLFSFTIKLVIIDIAIAAYILFNFYSYIQQQKTNNNCYTAQLASQDCFRPTYFQTRSMFAAAPLFILLTTLLVMYGYKTIQKSK